jgi:hypothetical protein
MRAILKVTMIILIAQQENASALHGMVIILIAQQENASALHGMVIILIAQQENASALHGTVNVPSCSAQPCGFLFHRRLLFHKTG